jgi:hypothetical protein
VKQLQLRKRREVGGLFWDSLRVFFGHFWLFVLLSAAVVIPVEVVVEGIGLEMLTGRFDESPPLAEAIVPTVVGFLVMTPIITAICIHALDAIAAGKRPSAGQVLVAGFEAFTPLFGAVVLAAIGIALGFLALIVPGIFLAVRWYFVPQAVVIDGARGPAALTRSSKVVEGLWWRTFGLVVLANLAVALPGVLLLAPFDAVAASSDQAVWRLVGTILTTSVTTPFVALYSTLLYYDLLARRAPATY